MKTAPIVLATVISLLGFYASADTQPIAPGSKAESVANTASNIISVSNLKIGNTAYKIVSMDSELNGDLTTTTIILVGEGAVGSAAGYDSAFQLSPTDQRSSLRSARIDNNEIELVFSNFNGKDSKTLVQYDAASKTLKER